MLLRQLKLRDRLITKRDQSFDVITAILQAVSLKRSVDTRMKFSIQPFPGDSGFCQWHDAMKMVARLPGGIPPEFRKRLWLTLSDRHIQTRKIDWRTTKRFCFNEKSNPDDNKLGTQIVKDLHRTGCSMFSGDDAEHNQALLKRVLLAYARWNKNVGYCQGFNMLAAIILEVMEWQEEDALKVMLFLIEGVLPESYFANHLRGLSVDMAVFRDLLALRLYSLSNHLDRLQSEARDSTTGTSYEPPLTNVFTMQWFLTLFSNCLPKSTVLRVWDLIFLEGNEVLLRTALAIWDGLADRIMTVESADEFYSIMGVLTREMLEFGLMDANDLVMTISTMAPFPFPQLSTLRDKYTYNIRPFTSSLSSRRTFKLFYSDDEDDDDEHIVMATWCVSNTLPLARNKDTASRGPSPSSSAALFTAISPGAVGPNVGNTLPSPSCSNVNAERMTLDLSALKKQYAKLKERQKQAHIILTGGFQQHISNKAHRPVAVNHLLLGKKPLVRKNKRSPVTTFAMKPMKEKESPTYSSKHYSKHIKQQATLPKESGETISWTQVKKQKKKSSREKSKDSSNKNADSNQTKNESDIKINFIDSDNSKISDNSSTSSSSTELCDEDITEPSDYMSSPEPHRKFSQSTNNSSDKDNITSSKEEVKSSVTIVDKTINTNRTVSKTSISTREGYDWSKRPNNLTENNESFKSETTLEVDKSIKESSSRQSESSSLTSSSSSSSSSPSSVSSNIELSEKSLNDKCDDIKISDTDDTSSEAKQNNSENSSDMLKTKSLSSDSDSENILPSDDDDDDDDSGGGDGDGDGDPTKRNDDVGGDDPTKTDDDEDDDNAKLKLEEPEESKIESRTLKTPTLSSFKERREQIYAQTYSPFPTLRRSSISGSVREVGIKLGIYGTDKQKMTKEGNQSLETNTLPSTFPR
ncbi:TBC1 domain family member 30-like isoform X1 [Centruroides sculpturatus]|uniref:TBC1 domain family member 30-like isoform X1 n=1 Tax=Centruroides sculpturatus TaxID=218467 RepID=UPI000C6D5666|nr:TBC1 domain family member 30-like isoform X1 [Centruroides sculpturatus]